MQMSETGGKAKMKQTLHRYYEVVRNIWEPSNYGEFKAKKKKSRVARFIRESYH